MYINVLLHTGKRREFHAFDPRFRRLSCPWKRFVLAPSVSRQPLKPLLCFPHIVTKYLAVNFAQKDSQSAKSAAFVIPSGAPRPRMPTCHSERSVAKQRGVEESRALPDMHPAGASLRGDPSAPAASPPPLRMTIWGTSHGDAPYKTNL